MTFPFYLWRCTYCQIRGGIEWQVLTDAEWWRHLRMHIHCGHGAVVRRIV